jgi:ABC-2 type transport system permease protein
VPAIVISYLVYALFVIVIELFAHSAVASALLQGSESLAQVLFTPLLALWSIWVGIAISTRMSDVRAAQQLSVLANIPLVILTSLFAFNVIHPTLQLALGLGVALIVVDRLSWRVVSAMFDRERLITGTR